MNIKTTPPNKYMTYWHQYCGKTKERLWHDNNVITTLCVYWSGKHTQHSSLTLSPNAISWIDIMYGFFFLDISSRWSLSYFVMDENILIPASNADVYEVKDLFPWEMFTNMVISCLLNVDNIWNSAQINLSSTLNFYRRYVFDATISTEKSTSEIDADLAQNDM